MTLVRLNAESLFARPMPYKVVWTRPDGTTASSVTFDRAIADRLYEQLEEEGRQPVLWLGGLVLAGVDQEDALRLEGARS